ncbi:MAG: Ig-like domain-containing protein, partial [Gemmatimonadota bacterium]
MRSEHGRPLSSHESRGPGSALSVLGVALAAALVLLFQACTNRDITTVVVSRVDVSPAAVRMSEGDTLTFTASVTDDRGDVLPPGADIQWSTDPPDLLSVDETGKVEALVRGLATVRATFGGVSDSAAVTITRSADVDVSAANGPTTESGGSATFTLALTAAPTADVNIALSLSDTTEATLAVDTVTFTSVDWDLPQTVTVTGRDDNVDDGDVTYMVVTAAISSGDPKYDGFDP